MVKRIRHLIFLLLSSCLFYFMACDTTTDKTGGDETTETNACSKYEENYASPSEDISKIIASYSASDTTNFAKNAMAVRYEFGKFIVQKAIDGSFGEDWFSLLGEGASADLLMLSTVVHEIGHELDNELSGFDDNAYQVNEDLIIKTKGGSCGDICDSSDEHPGFSRSLIKKDEYYKLRPSCSDAGADPDNCDSYADTYLDGDPTDKNFDSGDQGFNMLTEEVNQYTTSLALDYAFNDQIGSSSNISSRDGILTFLWYMERYLRMARLNYPDFYEYISTDSSWQKLIITLWNRAWYYLNTTKDIGKLGIDDAKILTLVQDKNLMSEIDLIKEKAGCK